MRSGYYRPAIDPYTGLRGALAPEYAELSPEELALALDELLGEGAAEELESLWSGFQRFARGAGNVLTQAAPAIGTVAGTLLGGPVGAAVGGAAGRALSGAVGGALGGPARGRGQHALQGLAGGALQGVAALLGGPGVGAPAPGAGHPPGAAANQLLAVLRRPETMQALLSLVAGPAGRRTVPVAGTPVPVGAFTNLLGALANRASAQHHAATAAESGGVPVYLLDNAGEFIGDPTDAVERADVLLGRLAAAELLEIMEDDGDAYGETDDPDYLGNELELEAMYDEIAIALDESA